MQSGQYNNRISSDGKLSSTETWPECDSSSASSSRQSVVTANSAPDLVEEPREPCPTPLDWRQVLKTFETESTPWQLDHSGRQIRGRKWGDGPPLYFLNGVANTFNLFGLTAFLLHEQFTCVFYDYPERNAVRARDRRTALGQHAADLVAISDYLEHKRFAVYGTSFGAVVALLTMLESPHRIECAILQSGRASCQMTFFERLLFGIGLRIPGRLRHVPFRASILEHNHLPWFPPFDPSRFDFVVRDSDELAISDVAKRAGLLDRLDLHDRLVEIEQRILLVSGEGDGSTLLDARNRLAEELRNVTVESLHSAGQLPYLTHPHRLAKLVRTFLLAEDVECG